MFDNHLLVNVSGLGDTQRTLRHLSHGSLYVCVCVCVCDVRLTPLQWSNCGVLGSECAESHVGDEDEWATTSARPKDSSGIPNDFQGSWFYEISDP